MKKFPVKIDLSTFFEDERKFVIVLVDPLWKSVECLQHRVEEIFDVRPVHFLTDDNLFIPPQESIEVMEFTGSLNFSRAFIPKLALEESRRRRSKKFNPEPLPTEKESVKKRKYHTLATEILDVSIQNQTKKSKCTPLEASNVATPVSNESQEITSTNEQTCAFKQTTKIPPNDSPAELGARNRKTSNSDILKNRSYTDKEEEGLVSISKPKKKRSHKREIETDGKRQNVNSETVQLEICSSTFLTNSKSIGKNTHIYFDDSTIVESTTNKQTNPVNTTSIRDKNKSPKVIFKCHLNNDITKPLVFPLQVINRSRKARKPLIDIQENILLPPANIAILIENELAKPLNNDFEKNILSNTFVAAENSNNVEAEGDIENVNNMESNDQLKSTKDDTNNNFELTEKAEINASITSELEKTSDLESTTKQAMEEIIHSSNESKEKADEKHISIAGENNQNRKSSANHTMTEPSGDESKSQKEPANNEAEIVQEESFVKITANTTDASNNSLELEESCVIDLDDDEDVIDLSDADDQQQPFQMTPNTSRLSETLNKSISAMSATEMLPFCTPLTSMPAVGDIVVFKFNRRSLEEKKDVSEYIACKCEHINRRTKVLKLAILDASLEKDIIPQHYVYNLDESLGDRFMSIKFPEMLDAKVMQT
ncbi:coilin isoform X1 [Rhagoletis pomonella]|uniref:coilin isoform X1 n=1 Tax=Rhagoletis pomonella TaxID=28610 RepID=UPI0017805542|nr:coilin isoform X1 [Rhagoletis pomonella]